MQRNYNTNNGSRNLKLAENVTFGGSALNRAAELRASPEKLAALASDTSARILPVWRGQTLFADAGRLGWLPLDHAILDPQAERVFLGLDDGGPRFGVDFSAWEPGETTIDTAAFFDPNAQIHPGLPDGYGFANLRGRMAAITARDAELAATARALLNWHATHKFCARCGDPSVMSQGGWQRDCPTCGGHHFPRTDPVVIMLILKGNDLLVGRSPGWPDGMFSLLAGFVEPGETIEAAVRREVFEESGIRVGQVDYLASQPWPFPSSLMIGCVGVAESRDITLDPVELEDAIWVSREETAEIFAGTHPTIREPRRGAIAHFLIKRWLEDNLD